MICNMGVQQIKITAFKLFQYCQNFKYPQGPIKVLEYQKPLKLYQKGILNKWPVEEAELMYNIVDFIIIIMQDMLETEIVKYTNNIYGVWFNRS